MCFKKYFQAFFSLFFPDLCLGCGHALFEGEVGICTECHADMPFTDHSSFHENAVAKQFWGRVEVKNAMALLYFVKGGMVQHLIHNLKYKGRQEVGHHIGALMGARLLSSDGYKGIDIILPVPLHPARKKARGYNQSFSLACGIAKILDLEARDDVLVRAKETSTQTKRSRFSRFENMLEVFRVGDPEMIMDKHILLVDDVITTGATLEACAIKLMDSGAASVSIAVGAFSE